MLVRNAELSPTPGGLSAAPSETRSSHGYFQSLAKVDLRHLRSANFRSVEAIHLSIPETVTIVNAIVADSTAAVTRIAAAARQCVGTGTDPQTVGALVHRVLTRSRFLKGSRSLLDVPTVVALVAEAVRDGAPIRLVARGFAFKQHDNRLKAAGRSPDLAELGGLLRLWELSAAISAAYPPGVELWIRRDGDYYRPRRDSDIDAYAGGLARLQQAAGLTGFARWFDDRDLLTELLEPAELSRRGLLVAEHIDLIETLVAPAAGRFDAASASAALAHRYAVPLAAGAVVDFADLFRSLLYSVPVPAPAGADPVDSARHVLSDIHQAWPPADVAEARQHVLAHAWRDTTQYIATQLADWEIGVWQRLPPHIRLTNTPGRQRGVAGFCPLGGSGLLPWHGTGFLDERGQVSVGFLAVLADRGYLPVTSDLLGMDQPFAMVPPALTTRRHGRLGLHPDAYARPRLRTR